MIIWQLGASVNHFFNKRLFSSEKIGAISHEFFKDLLLVI